ncbi:invasin domain 3-containing protein [uncultured Methanobrevibacter sp.]|uniref:invasin domain 3-containing protein n=1 Tax=uncultured Methanobrevibacter sp. TaxID=253161 RepID=UPI0025F7F948|nr:invasin domain 3-containing protein [uncultured Methanobrevibacter sp.]
MFLLLLLLTLDEGIQDVVLEDNSIQWVTADSPAKATAMGIRIVGGENGVSSDIKLINNEITISGDAANIYGIDCYSNPWNYDGDAITGLLVKDNMITINGPGFVEGIYLSHVTDSKVTGNDIGVESTGGNVYGVGTDNIHDVNVEGNTISATTTAEGKTAAGINLYQSDINEKANDITVSGATAQDIKTDAASAVYAIVENDNYDQYFDESGNYINDSENIALGDLSNKDLTFSSPVNVKGALGAKLTDVTIKLTADASGSSIDGLTFIYDGASNIITLAAGIENINITNNNIQFKSTGYYNAAIAAGDWSDGPASHMKITSNNINVTSVNAAYGIDIMGIWGNLVNIDSIISDNNIVVQANGMAEGIYLTSVSNCNVTYNDIITTINDAGDSIGIAVDGCNDITISGNVIDTTSKQAAFGIANSFNTNTIISNNDVTVDGVSAIGIGTGYDTGAVIEGNSIDVTAGDYENTETMANAIGTGNSGIKLANNASAEINGNYINSNQKNMDLDGASSDTKVGSNYVKEYIEKEGNPDLPYAPKATTITVQSATVTADPNGKSKTQNIAITVKDANGNPVAGQTVQVYVNGALKTAKTNDKGVATLAVPYKAGGTVSLVASFNGATGLLGSSATGKLTVKKNAVKIAAKTKKVKKSKAKKAKVKITLKVGKTALKKKAVTIKINKKTYKAKTNAKGIATFKVKLPKKAKKYKYTVKFAGDNFNKAKTFKGKLTVK